MSDVNDLEFDLQWHIYSLFEKEPFFAAISRHVDKRPSNAIPTAGVRVTSDGHYEMLYNQNFFAKLPVEQRIGVLKHEFYHLVLEHVNSRLPEGGMTKMWNIATDLAINSYLPGEIPEFGCIPGKGQFADYPAHQTAEWYLAKLMKDKQDGNDKGEGNDSLDDHSGWSENGGEIDPAVKEIAKQRLKEMMKNAVEECNKTNSWGSVTGDMKQDIIDRCTTKVDWRSVLRYFIKTSRRANKHNTVKRLNKRFPYIHAGVKIQRVANIAISIDQSGSVGDDMLIKFFSELNNLSKLATFTVIPFDTEVDDKLVYEWKKGMHRKAERVKCGGTDFSAPTKYVNDHGFDGHN